MKSRHDTVILERRFVPKDQVLIKEGEFGQQAYLIQSGEVLVFISKDGKEHRFIRADKFTNRDDCADIAISKGQLIVDQLGDRMFT